MLLQASNGSLGESLSLHDIVARLEGTDRRHELSVNLSGEPVNAAFRLAGALDRKTLVWKGALSDGSVSTPIGRWRQDKAAGLVFDASKTEAVLEPHCWVGKARRRLSRREASRGRKGNWRP